MKSVFYCGRIPRRKTPYGSVNVCQYDYGKPLKLAEGKFIGDVTAETILFFSHIPGVRADANARSFSVQKAAGVLTDILLEEIRYEAAVQTELFAHRARLFHRFCHQRGYQLRADRAVSQFRYR